MAIIWPKAVKGPFLGRFGLALCTGVVQLDGALLALVVSCPVLRACPACLPDNV